MVTKLARQVRCEDVLRHFGKDTMTFFTFTTKDVVTYQQIRDRWRNLRHYLVEKYQKRDLKYVMNYELHPKGHGWHIHAVFNNYINLRRGGLLKIRSFGFGMVRVEKVDSLGVANYLSKHCLKAYRGVKAAQKGMGRRLRLVNCSRGLPRLSDYGWKSAYNDRVRRFLRLAHFRCTFGGLPFDRRYLYASFAVLNNWDSYRLKAAVFHRHVDSLPELASSSALSDGV